jgi:hypothetical protein
MGKPGSKNTRRRRLGRNYPGKKKMEGFDGGGEDSWRVIKPKRRRIKRRNISFKVNVSVITFIVEKYIYDIGI